MDDLLLDKVRVLQAENEMLRERVDQLEGVLFRTDRSLPVEWLLTPQEARLLGALIKREHCTKDQLMMALYGDRHSGEEAEPKIVDVVICKTRRKLKPFNIAIKTHWGHGYFIPPEQRKLLLEEMKGLGA